ncbi:capsid protein [Nudaurelia capensis omega virus]|uniref:Capsid protein n=2 Tax=Nudaurelia capensis omega virus TaxID=12541 RepID=Q90063_9VIRU|nr:capsid protein [Nudaurelia capensis omega virus]AAB23198.1 capsid protein [Nudaurelia capensis omega virus]
MDSNSASGKRRSRNVRIAANTVNVAPKQRQARGRRARSRANNIDNVTAAAQELGQSLDANVITFPTNVATMPEFRSWARGKLDIDQDSIGWYFKYLDPAGATESARAVGEYSKIPDGLVKFSVDAEIREIYNEECPTVSDASIPLDGAQWSLSIISYPMFRTAYFAVANVDNKEISLDVTNDLIVWLNNLASWRDVVDSGQWFTFSDDPTWFVRIRVLHPTYDLPDPTEGLLRTCSDYRLTYKSITCEANMPTLVDQGFWIGGHYALTPIATTQNAVEGSGFEHPFNVTRPGIAAGVTLTWASMPPGGSAPSGDPAWIPDSTTQFQWRHGGFDAPTGVITYTIPRGYTMQYFDTTTNEWNGFANPDDVVTFGQTGGAAGTNATITITAPTVTLTILATTTSAANVINFRNLDAETTAASNRSEVPLPPLTFGQTAPNNPKIEQTLVKDTLGSYLVHSKMRNPVFQLTPASSFGAISFTNPGFDRNLDLPGFGGIRDSLDVNMSTAVCHFRSLSKSCSIVTKTYQGWEGVTNVNTPFGQFAHSGLLKNDEILCLADDLATRLTGVYGATDNFAAAVLAFAANMLTSVLKSEATTSVIKELGNQATGLANQGLARLPGLLASIPGKIAARVRARRDRRRAARMNNN